MILLPKSNYTWDSECEGQSPTTIHPDCVDTGARHCEKEFPYKPHSGRPPNWDIFFYSHYVHPTFCSN